MNKEKYFSGKYFNDTISSTILFILAYLFVLYVSLFSTAFIAFTNHLDIPLQIDKIDFDRAISSNHSIWDSSENIFVIFSFAPLIIFILGLLSLMLTHKYNKKAFGVFLFWVIFHCIMRFFGDFIFGHIFGLWSSNLVSDFMGLTYQNIYLKLFFIALSLVGALFSPLILTPLIHAFFNPINNNIKQGLKNNFIIPISIGLIVIFLWFLPFININEIGIFILIIVGIYLFCRFINKKYRSLNIEEQQTQNQGYNIQLSLIAVIIFTVILILAKIILTQEIVLRSSAFRREQLDNIFYSSLITGLSLAFLLSIGYLVYNRNKKKEKANKYLEEVFKTSQEQKMDPKMLEGTKWDYQSSIQETAQKYNNSED